MLYKHYEEVLIRIFSGYVPSPSMSLTENITKKIEIERQKYTSASNVLKRSYPYIVTNHSMDSYMSTLFSLAINYVSSYEFSFKTCEFVIPIIFYNYQLVPSDIDRLYIWSDDINKYGDPQLIREFHNYTIQQQLHRTLN